MNTAEKSTLEPLQGGEADASTSRRMLIPEEQEGVRDTRAGLEGRWIVPRRKPEPAAENSQGRFSPQYRGTQPGNHNTDQAPAPTLVHVPQRRLYPEKFLALQRFEGTVLSVSEDSFIARLIDRTNRGPEEEAEFPVIEVMPGDQELVRPGAVFYWVIGYEAKIHGQQSRSSIIRFRRLPAWTPNEIDDAKAAAKAFLSFLDLNDADRPA